MGRRLRIKTAVVVALVVIVSGSLLGWWDWKAVIGWKALVSYIAPEDATGRKDALQVYAVILAGLVATVTAAVGLTNLYYTRKNLEQQREIEEKRAKDTAVLEAQRDQGSALQAYYEQMGKLLTEHDLGNTLRIDIRLLARAQTLTVLESLDPPRKSRLMQFLTGSALVQKRVEEKPPIIVLHRANLSKADLRRVDLCAANLSEAYLSETDLSGANLSGAFLQKADLKEADLRWADLRASKVTEEQLADCESLEGATLPDGSKHD